jgi:hypothetical protein
MPAKQIPLTAELLALTEKSYDEYNTVLTDIMTRLPFDAQVQTFQRVLEEELPLTTARRAYRTAIKVALGEENVYREYQPPVKKKHKPEKTTQAKAEK